MPPSMLDAQATLHGSLCLFPSSGHSSLMFGWHNMVFKSMEELYKTFELARETAARGRREQRLAASAAAAAGADPSGQAGAAEASAPTPAAKPSKKEKTLNLNTYKWHALGDYVATIQLFGPSDSYSTQLGESLHRLVKRLYAVTNKRNHTAQIGARYMRLVRARTAARASQKRRHGHHVGFGQQDPLGATPPDWHHHTSNARRYPIDLFKFPGRPDDPAIADFIPKLQDHLLGRLLGRDFDGDTHDEFTPADRNTVFIINNKIYASKTLRVNYTTYDVRRDQDTLNPRTSAFLMVRSPETEAGAHPYWYCQLLGVFRASVFRVTQSGRMAAKEMEFLWVRWLGVEPGYRAGIKRAKLPKVGFVPESDPYAFGFLDPAQVIRGSHLIPVFSGGRTNDLLATREVTAARDPDDSDDWTNYYVDIFVDRDMFMRYFGGGIGHLTVHESQADGPDEEMAVDEVDGGDREPGDQDFDDSEDGSENGDGADELEDDDSEQEEGDEDGPIDEEEFGPEEEVQDDLGFADF
ncbi:hypothetical protein B0H11DRAFT_2279748 [Mycena galericulata]|nr:hypothetical protein B0H11DRAFT_2279748 [Mycena galericulata]